MIFYLVFWIKLFYNVFACFFIRATHIANTLLIYFSCIVSIDYSIQLSFSISGSLLGFAGCNFPITCMWTKCTGVLQNLCYLHSFKQSRKKLNLLSDVIKSVAYACTFHCVFSLTIEILSYFKFGMVGWLFCNRSLLLCCW